MEFFYGGIRCFAHLSHCPTIVEIVAPVPQKHRASPEIPSVSRSPLPEIKQRPHSAEPSKLRSSPLSSQEYQKQRTMINDKFKKTFKNFEPVKNVAKMITREINGNAKSDQEREWMKLCNVFKQTATNSNATNAIGKQVIGNEFSIDDIDAEALYVKILHFRIDRLFNINVKVLDKFEMFKKYNPVVMYIVQKEFTQDNIIPSAVENYLSFDEAVRQKLLPVNIKTYIVPTNDHGETWNFCCVGLFHSFVHRINFVSGYWKSNKGNWISSLINFDRHLDQSKNNI